VRCTLEAVGPAFLRGISLGAAVAAQYPALVVRRILIAPPVAPAPTHQRLLTRHRRCPGWLVRLVTDQPDRAAWLTVHAQLEATDLTPVLPTSGVPTLVLCGGRDRASQPDARRTAQAIAVPAWWPTRTSATYCPRGPSTIAKGFFPMR